MKSLFSLIDLQSTNVNEFTGLVKENENGILTLGGVENGFGPNGQTQSMMLTLSADGRTLQVSTGFLASSDAVLDGHRTRTARSCQIAS